MAIVLVPGFMLDEGLWRDVLPDLQRFRPIHYADPRAATSLHDMAQRTLATAPDTFALVGFSMGGYVAREMVRLAPDRVSRLVLIATSARGDTPAQARRKSDAASLPFTGISASAVRKSLAPEREGDTKLVRQIQAMGQRLGAETFRRQALFQRNDDLQKLSTVACPTLVIAGSRDRLRSIDEAQELTAGIPDATLLTLDCGHMVPMECPGELGGLLTQFIGRK